MPALPNSETGNGWAVLTDLTASDKAVGGAGYEAILPKPLPAADSEAASRGCMGVQARDNKHILRRFRTLLIMPQTILAGRDSQDETKHPESK